MWPKSRYTIIIQVIAKYTYNQFYIIELARVCIILSLFWNVIPRTQTQTIFGLRLNGSEEIENENKREQYPMKGTWNESEDFDLLSIFIIGI